MKDLTGQKFARLTVLERASDRITPQGKHVIRWLCLCDCGKTCIVYGAKLRSGHTKSCGCYQVEQTVKASKTHGLSDTKLYIEWRAMKDRCSNPNVKAYKNYGGRGIKVCEDWAKDFGNYYNFVSALPHFGESGYSLNRIDNDGNYEPENVEWATAKDQANNRRSNRVVVHKGETRTIAEWAELHNMPQNVVRDRIMCLGWDVESALTTPIRKQKNNRLRGETQNDDK